MAAIPPVSAARSVSARMRSLAVAENVRRWGRGESSGDAADGAGTVAGFRASLLPAAFFASIGPSVLGLTTMSVSCAQVSTRGAPVSHRHWHRGLFVVQVAEHSRAANAKVTSNGQLRPTLTT